ncbi:MAG: alanine--glyoxylate aminotransferase family protein [Planctomycetota bacterium]
MRRPLLMIPGPIEVSDAVLAAAAVPPPSHLDPALIEDFGRALRAMRAVWLAAPEAQPFAVAGGGTLAMESAAVNLLDPGQRAVLVNTGTFGDRMAEMLRRRGVEVVEVGGPPGEAPSLDAVAAAADAAPCRALFATHVDTSTGVRVDAAGLARLARERDLLSIFDGVCATAAERFEMQAWDADVYLTASQKAIGLPAGLALWVASPRALEARARLRTPPPLTLDWEAWRPIHQAYEEGRPSYFSTPPTTLLPALRVGLDEILADGMEGRFALHERTADAMRAAWSALGLSLVPRDAALAANTLSALRYPPGVDAALLPRIKAHGAIVAGGLHAQIRDEYFRVGHMGVTVTRPEDLLATVRAVGLGLVDQGHACDVEAAVEACRTALERDLP